jgi:hypothetical protein
MQLELGDDRWTAQAGSNHVLDGANAVLTPEQSSVTSFTNDGQRITGEAVFYSTYNYAEIETGSGTFDFYCR